MGTVQEETPNSSHVGATTLPTKTTTAHSGPGWAAQPSMCFPGPRAKSRGIDTHLRLRRVRLVQRALVSADTPESLMELLCRLEAGHTWSQGRGYRPAWEFTEALETGPPCSSPTKLGVGSRTAHPGSDTACFCACQKSLGLRVGHSHACSWQRRHGSLPSGGIKCLFPKAVDPSRPQVQPLTETSVPPVRELQWVIPDGGKKRPSAGHVMTETPSRPPYTGWKTPLPTGRSHRLTPGFPDSSSPAEPQPGPRHLRPQCCYWRTCRDGSPVSWFPGAAGPGGTWRLGAREVISVVTEELRALPEAAGQSLLLPGKSP